VDGATVQVQLVEQEGEPIPRHNWDQAVSPPNEYMLYFYIACVPVACTDAGNWNEGRTVMEMDQGEILAAYRQVTAR
jgi:hypothetical protein